MDYRQAPTFMEKAQMFDKCDFCKIFEATDKHPTGHIPHYHDYTQIWYVRRGCCEHWLEGKKYEMARGNVFVLPPSLAHMTQFQKDSAIICCEFDLNQLFGEQKGADTPSISLPVQSALNIISFNLFFSQNDKVKSNFVLSPMAEQEVGARMKTLLREYEEERVYYQEFLRVEIQGLLLLLAREFHQSPIHDASVEIYNQNKAMMEKAIEYIDEHYAEQLTLEQVCRLSSLSKTYFCYLFKLMTQQTFVEYMLNLRIRHASALLENSSLSITTIGGMVGFNDSTHFSRTFHRLVGMSPRSYRSLKRGSGAEDSSTGSPKEAER